MRVESQLPFESGENKGHFVKDQLFSLGAVLGADDQVIRENPASRGTETSAEVLVGPPLGAGGWSETPVNSSGTRLTLTRC